MTDRCKNITLAKTSFRPVNIVISQWQIQDFPEEEVRHSLILRGGAKSLLETA